MVTTHADSGIREDIYQDECNNLYSSVMSRALHKVNPSLAVSNVIGSSFGNTFAILSKYSGQGFQNFFYHIPLLWTPVVLPLVFIVMVVFLIFLCGYDIRTPFISFRRSQNNLLFASNTIPNVTQPTIQQPPQPVIQSTPPTQHITYHDNRRVIQVQHRGNRLGSTLDSTLLKMPLPRRQSSSSSSSSIEVVAENGLSRQENSTETFFSNLDSKTRQGKPSPAHLRRVHSMSSLND
jgi:hypothetical protein